MKWYRVLFEFKGQPLRGWNVSQALPYSAAKFYYDQIKNSGYDPELVEIKDGKSWNTTKEQIKK